MVKLARLIDSIPVVATEAERDALYASPAEGQRVKIRDGEEQEYRNGGWRNSPSFFAAQRAQGVHWVTDPEYGARGNGTTDDTAAVQAAATAAGTDGVLYFPPGTTFAVNGTITIYGPVMGKGCLLNWSGTGDAIVFAPTYSGTGAIPGFIQNETVFLPRLVNTNKTVAGWAQAGVAGSVGVRVRHTYNSRIIIPHVQGFETGVLFYGEHDGSDYNHVHIGLLLNNKRNLMADATSDGWCNENNVFGGRLSHDPAEGASAAGTRQILLAGGTSTTNILNNWRFWGVSLEGDVPEYHVETMGSDNLWDHCRWETSSTARFLSNGAYAISNVVRGGFASHLISYTVINGARNPTYVQHRDTISMVGAAAGAVLNLENGNSSASPIIRAYNAGQDLLGAGTDTNWVWQLWAQGLQGKASGDATTVKRFFVDPTTGFTTMAKAITGTVDSGGGIVSVADGGGTATLRTGFNAGLVLIEDSNTGQSALIWIGSGAAILAGGTTNYSLVQGTASHYNVYTSGGNLMVENRRGTGTAAISALVLRLL